MAGVSIFDRGSAMRARVLKPETAYFYAEWALLT